MKEKAGNALSHKVEFFGKSVPTVLIAALVLVGTGSAALLSTYGTITGETEVTSQAVGFTNDADNVLFYDFNNEGNAVLGETYRQLESLESNINSQTEVQFSTRCNKDGSYDDGSRTGMDLVWSNYNGPECDGIRTRFVEYFDNAGHDFSGYSSPSDSDADVIVDDDGGEDFTSIQAAIDDSNTASGDTILVREGSYSGTVEVDKSDLTLVAENRPSGSSPSTISGASTGVRVTASGVTVKGFDVTANTPASANARGIDVQSANVKVESNRVHDVVAEERPIGIFVWGDQNDVDGSTVENNNVFTVKATEISGSVNHGQSKTRGIVLDSDSSATNSADNLEVSFNTVRDIGGDGDSAMSNGVEVNGGTGQDFNISFNTIRDVDHNASFGYTPTAGAVYVTGYSQGEDYGPNHMIGYNNLLLEGIADSVDVKTFDNPDASTLNANNNYWDEDGISYEVSDVLYTEESANSEVSVSWLTKPTPVQLEGGEVDRFGAHNSFAANLAPGTYNVTTQVIPN